MIGGTSRWGKVYDLTKDRVRFKYTIGIGSQLVGEVPMPIFVFEVRVIAMRQHKNGRIMTAFVVREAWMDEMGPPDWDKYCTFHSNRVVC